VKSLHLQVFKPRSRAIARRATPWIKGVELEVKTVEYMCFPLAEMKEGVLYMLRPFHPVIDAAIKTANVVYLIQLSTVSYSAHESKIENIFDISRTESKGLSIFEFYKKMSKCLHCTYVYISPKNLKGQLLKKMSECETAKWQHKGVRFGTILPESASSQFIEQIHSMVSPTS
jgi:hypothetical protein